MTIQVTSRVFVCQDVLVNPLVTDLDGMLPAQPPRDLLWAPIQMQLRFVPLPCFRQDVNSAVIAAAKRLVLSLLGTVASQTAIAAQLPTYVGFVCANHNGDFASVMSHFQQGIYLVSLCLGKLRVAHKRSFDLVVREALILPQLTSLSTFKVALVS